MSPRRTILSLLQGRVRNRVPPPEDMGRFDGAEYAYVTQSCSRNDSFNTLSVKKRERLRVLPSQAGWRYAEKMPLERQGVPEQGYIPSSYVHVVTGQENGEWFMVVDRDEAERLVLRHGLPRGSFVVRFSESKEGDYSLTIRNCVNERAPRVENYRIERCPSSGPVQWRIARRKNSLPRENTPTYSSVNELVRHHMKEVDGLCCLLTLPVAALGQTSEEIIDLDGMVKLGEGNFGAVFKGTWKGMVVAVKVQHSEYTEDSKKEFLNESGLLTGLLHPHIVRLYVCLKGAHMMQIVTEFMREGSLLDYVKKFRTKGGTPQCISPRVFLLMAAQIASGMAHLEEKGVIHRDLAARNVLVGCVTADVPIVKVADFGLARAASEYTPWSSKALPVRWLAPECCPNSTQRFTSKSDIWSFGLVLFEMYSYGIRPFHSISEATRVFSVIQDGRREEQPIECPDEVFSIMEWCWQMRPEERPFFSDLVLFFDDLAMDRVLLHYSSHPSIVGSRSMIPSDHFSAGTLRVSKRTNNCRICEGPTDTLKYAISCRACAAFYNRAKTSGAALECICSGRNCALERGSSIVKCKKCRFDKFVHLIEAVGPKILRYKDCPAVVLSTSSVRSSETPVLDRIRKCYNNLCLVSRAAEFAAGAKISGFTKVTKRLMDQSSQTLIVALFDFVTGCLDEFAEFSELLKQQILSDYFYSFISLDDAFRTAKEFPNDEKKCFIQIMIQQIIRLMVGSTLFLDGDDLVSGVDSSVVDDNEAKIVIGKHLHDSRKYVDIMVATPIDDTELMAALGLELWNGSTGLVTYPDGVAEIFDRHRAELLRDFHAYYSIHLGSKDYASRLGRLFSVMTEIKGHHQQLREYVEMCRLAKMVDEEMLAARLMNITL